jgi:hypothetical protein
MRRSDAMALLAAAHARIVELADAGVDPSELAVQLDMEPSAVGPLLRVARSKLAALEAMDEPEGSEVPGGTP